jgi:hypothetical protein
MPESIHDFFLKHDGIDWIAAVFMFLSMYRLGHHKKDGFIYAALASAFWIIFNIRVDSAAGVIANIIIAIMAFRSLSTWNKTHPSTTPNKPSPNEPRP